MYTESTGSISSNWTRENLAWMAGLFEGEGWVGWKKPPTSGVGGGRLDLRLSMADQDIIERLATIASVGSVHGPYRKFTPDGREIKRQWYFQAYGKDAYALIIAIIPWLGQRRREQAKSAIEMWMNSHPKRMFTADQIRYIKDRIKNGVPLASLAREFEVARGTIRKIRDGKVYQYVD